MKQFDSFWKPLLAAWTKKEGLGLLFAAAALFIAFFSACGVPAPPLPSSLVTIRPWRPPVLVSVRRFAVGASAAAPNTTVTVCAFANGFAPLVEAAFSIKHAVHYYGSPEGGGFGRFPPSITWQFRFIGDATLTRRNYIRSWILSSSSTACSSGTTATPAPIAAPASSMLTTTLPCDVLVGPGFSSLAQAMSPVVDSSTVWVDPSASSVSLSNKEQYPFFSRVTPSDAVGATLGGVVLQRFRWTDVNLLCLDDPYGRSVFQEMSDAVVAMNGTVHYARCLLTDATKAQMLTELHRIRQQSPSRLIFMAMLPGPAFERIVDVVQDNGLDEEFVFFFSDAACTTDPLYYAQLKSALCAVYAPNTTKVAGITRSYKARNTSLDVEALEAQGATVPAMDLTATGVMWSYAHDAASHAMASAVTKMGNASMTGPESVRATTTVGASGTVRLLRNGDRPSAAAAVYNALGGQQHRAVGYIEDGVLVFARPDGAPDPSLQAPTSLVLFGGTVLSIPSVLTPPIPSPGPDRTAVAAIAAALCAAVVAFAAAAASYFGVTTLRMRRLLRRCPSDPEEPFAAFFVSVKNEAQLRDDLGAAAAEAICQRVESAVDKAAEEAGCVVARRLDAHFLVVATTPQAAVTAAANLTVALHWCPWPRCESTCDGADNTHAPKRSTALESSACRSHSVRSHSVRSHSAQSLSRGAVPSVSVGCAFAAGRIKRTDADAGTHVPFRYSGEPVDQAAGLADVARGGQVLCSGALHDALLDSGVSVAGLGELQEAGLQTLPGTDTAFEVYELDVAGVPSRSAGDDGSRGPSSPSTPLLAVGGVLSALEAAGGGLATRNVAVVAVRVQAMARHSVLAATADAAVAAVTDAAAPHKGRVVMVLDATIYVAVNAVGPAVSQAATRAAAIALEAVGAVELATGRGASAGLEFGPCATGAVTPQADAKRDPTGLVIANSGIGARAAALARLAETGPCRVVTGDAAHGELRVGYSLLTVDLLGFLPAPHHNVGSSASPLSAAAQSSIPPIGSSSPAPYLNVSVAPARDTLSVRPVHGVLHAHGEEDGLDAEWMYRLSDLDAGDPHAVSNAAFAVMAAGDDPWSLLRQPVHPSSAAVSFSAPPSLPSLPTLIEEGRGDQGNSASEKTSRSSSPDTVLPIHTTSAHDIHPGSVGVHAATVAKAINRCPGASFAAKVQSYAEWRRVSVTAALPVAMPTCAAPPPLLDTPCSPMWIDQPAMKRPSGDGLPVLA